MSAFLGPIHNWVYNKIQIQQEIVEEIIKISKEIIPELKEKLDREYGISETGVLEHVIDESNIHGWLQKNVSQAEKKLADSVTTILKENPDSLEDMKQIFKEKGKENSAGIEKENASSAYKVLTDTLLDGMPCDHANSLIENSEEKVIWKRNACVHKEFWDGVNGDITIYYVLREEFIKGCLEDTGLTYEKADENTNIIKRSGAHV